MEKNIMEEKVRLSILLDIYKNILTEKQYEYMDYYCNQDLGVTEIANNKKISRQATSRMLMQSKEKLEELEKNLQIMKKQQEIKKQLEKLKQKNIEPDIIKNIEAQLDF